MRIANHCKRDKGNSLGELGSIIEYEFPIKASDESFGKVDLISYNKSSNTLYLVEAKVLEGAKDTLLRAILEIKSYSQALKGDFLNPNSFFRQMNYPEIAEICYNNLQVRNAIMLIRTAKSLKKTWAEEQYLDIKKYPSTHELLEKWDIDVYQVTEEIPYEVKGSSGNYRTVKLQK